MIDISYEFDTARKEIQFDICNENFSISYNEDVDLTCLISKLTKLLDKKEELNNVNPLDISLLEDEKEKIIQNTIQAIIKNFNDTINDRSL